MTDERIIERMTAAVLESFPPDTTVPVAEANRTRISVQFRLVSGQTGSLTLPRDLVNERGAACVERMCAHIRRIGPGMGVIGPNAHA